VNNTSSLSDAGRGQKPAQKTLNASVTDRLRDAFAAPGERSNRSLNAALRLLAKWRGQLIANNAFRHAAGAVASGPFAGMHLVRARVSEGAATPRVLGTYESELHSIIEQVIANRYEHIAVVGCAEGYYAVGLARRCPWARIYAFDTDQQARKQCEEAVTLNEVSARVTVAATFHPDLLPVPSGTFILCDVEGAESTLMDPAAYPSLLSAPLLVIECHEDKSPGIIKILTDRFSPTHEVKIIAHSLSAPVLPKWLQELGHLDQLLAMWEWRESPTPWLVMTRTKIII